MGFNLAGGHHSFSLRINCNGVLLKKVTRGLATLPTKITFKEPDSFLKLGLLNILSYLSLNVFLL